MMQSVYGNTILPRDVNFSYVTVLFYIRITNLNWNIPWKKKSPFLFSRPRRKVLSSTTGSFHGRATLVLSSLILLFKTKGISFSVRDASSVNSDEESTLKRPVVGSPITSSKVVNARAVLQFEPDVFTGMKQVMLRIRYRGDIGYAFPTVKCSMIISVMELPGR